MARLQWDKVGDRRYEAGVDRGVLYAPSGVIVPWNGLTGVDMQASAEVQTAYLDGVKYLSRAMPGEFAATLKAFTYPEEFELLIGVEEVLDGLSYHEQMPKTFSLSYRTRVGNDVDGPDHGYKLHILYNVLATPSAAQFQTLGDQVQPMEFSWDLTAIPVVVPGYRPTVHVVIDSTKTDPVRLAAIEELLYGFPGSYPRLPSIVELTETFANFNSLIVTDNGDGTWTAVDLSNTYITMLDEGTFQIANADATFIASDKYTLSTTTPEGGE